MMKTILIEKKVKDHCHYPGKFRGAAYSKCKLNYKVLKDIPIFQKFDETALPPKEAFYSNLNLEHISDEDYAHAQKV